MSSTTFTISVTNSPPARKYRPGHWLAIGNGSGRRNTYHTGSGTSDLLALPGLQGIQLRYPWIDLEPTPGVFDLTPIQTDLARCATKNSQLIVMLEDKSFAGGGHVTPTDLRGAQHSLPNDNGGYSAVRWNDTIIARWGKLIQAVGQALDAHPNFHGLAFIETAIGLNATQRQDTNYSPTKYRDAQIAQLVTASDACPTSRCFWYSNFMPNPTDDHYLQEVADTLRDYNGGNSGVLLGGPDILPDNTAITTRCLPRYGSPPVGSFGELKLFCSMQNDSYRHIHTTTSDPRMPGYSWAVGTTWTMDDLFVFGRDYMKLNYIIWNFYVAAGGQEFEPDGRLVIAANPTFNSHL